MPSSFDVSTDDTNVIYLDERRPKTDVAAFSDDALSGKWISDVSACISALGGMRENWDTYNGVAPTRNTLTYSAMVASRLWRSDLSPPHVTATSSGAVSMEWQNGEKELVFEVQSPGRLAYLYVDGEAEQTGEATDSLAPLQDIIDRLLTDVENQMQA